MSTPPPTKRQAEQQKRIRSMGRRWCSRPKAEHQLITERGGKISQAKQKLLSILGQKLKILCKKILICSYKVAINLRPGDALLVDNAGIIHGNTPIIPPAGMDVEDMERIPMVSYMQVYKKGQS